jgi:deoxyhypusine synthase
MGRELAEIATEDGIITSAYKARIPIYCPNIANSEICVGIAQARFEKKTTFAFDLAQDTLELMQLAHRSRTTCLLTLGDTNSNNLIQLSDIALNILKSQPRGHKYIVTIAPKIDCGSGKTGSDITKLFGRTTKNSMTTFVQCDPTIAFPLIVTALSQTAAKYMKGRKRPTFIFAGREMNIEIP